MCTWHDDNAIAGDVTYGVAGEFDGKEGRKASVNTWVGLDVPKPVTLTSVKTVNGNMNVVVDWTPCEGSQHGAYFVPENVTYSLYRGYNRNELAPIATGLRTTTFTDTDIAGLVEDSQDSYFYGVSAENEAGIALSSAEIVAVGKPYTFPQVESFPRGQFNIRPWLTDPISGSFSWECVTNDGGLDGQDHDRGFSKFYAYWGGNTDSRLKSPVFTLDGTENPIFALWMFHWLDSSVAADNGATKLLVEISVDGGEWQPLGEPLLAGYPVYGWVEHRFPLSGFKNAGTVQFGLRGQTDNSWMCYYIDNLQFIEQPGNDIAVSDFYGDTEVEVGGSGTYVLNYFNRGVNVADGYAIELYRNGELVSTAQGESLNPGESASQSFVVEYNHSMTGESILSARIVYDADENPANNESNEAATYVEKSLYPTVENLEGTFDESGNAVLCWQAPQLPEPGETVLDGAEEYESFLISGFGKWLTIDGDGQGSGYYTDLPDWPNRGSNQAFIIWCPGDIAPSVADDYPELIPYKGDKCFAAWLANVSDWGYDPQNDDYLVSPEITGGTKVKFWVKSASSDPENESFEVMYSTTNRDKDSFTALYSGAATGEWLQVEADMPEDARFFAIHYTASFERCLMVDDIEYVPVDGVLELLGYNVYRNNELITPEPVAEPAFTDNEPVKGNNVYSVAAVYDRGSSDGCPSISLSAESGISDVESENAVTVTTDSRGITVAATAPVCLLICRIDGVVVYNAPVGGSTTVSLPGGMYIVKAGNTVRKVVL